MLRFSSVFVPLVIPFIGDKYFYFNLARQLNSRDFNTAVFKVHLKKKNIYEYMYITEYDQPHPLKRRRQVGCSCEKKEESSLLCC